MYLLQEDMSYCKHKLSVKLSHFRYQVQEVRKYYVCWSVTLRKEHSLRVFENGVLRRIFGPKRDEVTGEWSYTVGSFIICTYPQILLGRSNQEE
jgi:hypothetical protein